MNLDRILANVALAKILDAGAMPGPWEYQNVQNREDHSAHGTVTDPDGKILFDTLNSDVATIHSEYEDGAYHWDSVAEANLTFAAEARTMLPALVADIESLVAIVTLFQRYGCGFVKDGRPCMYGWVRYGTGDLRCPDCEAAEEAAKEIS